MIRTATKYDKTQIKDMLKEFHAESDFAELGTDYNEEYFDLLLDRMFAGQGVVFLEENKGLLVAMILPTIWNDKVYAMFELAWYVRPEHRNTTIGYRLFVSYLNYGKRLKEENRIAYFTMTKLDNSGNLKYEKYGFRKKDENWIQ